MQPREPPQQRQARHDQRPQRQRAQEQQRPIRPDGLGRCHRLQRKPGQLPRIQQRQARMASRPMRPDGAGESERRSVRCRAGAWCTAGATGADRGDELVAGRSAGRAAGRFGVVRTGADAAGCDGSVDRGAGVNVGETATGAPVDGCDVTVVCGVEANVDACGWGLVTARRLSSERPSEAAAGAGRARERAPPGAPSIRRLRPIDARWLYDGDATDARPSTTPVRRALSTPLHATSYVSMLRADDTPLCCVLQPIRRRACHRACQQTDQRERGQSDRDALVSAPIGRSRADHGGAGRRGRAALRI